MCTLSMVLDHYNDEWQRRWLQPQPMPAWPYIMPVQPSVVPVVVPPTQVEIDEFRRLLERARIYDRENGQPDCELEEKRKKIKDLATQLGVEIDFV